MTFAQEVRIVAVTGLEVPEGLEAGSTFAVRCELRVANVDQDWIDVTTIGGKPEHLPGRLTLECFASVWSAS